MKRTILLASIFGAFYFAGQLVYVSLAEAGSASLVALGAVAGVGATLVATVWEDEE